MFAVTPTQLRAEITVEPFPTTITSVTKSSDTNVETASLREIKPIDLSLSNSSEKKELLKELGLIKSDQDGRSRRYRERHPQREVDLTIRTNHQEPRDGYPRNHNHRRAYVGGGGVFILILILILIL